MEGADLTAMIVNASGLGPLPGDGALSTHPVLPASSFRPSSLLVTAAPTLDILGAATPTA